MKQTYLLILIFVFASCNSKKSQEKEYSSFHEVETITIPYVYNPEDSIYVNLERYNVKNKLYSLLDSTIVSAEACPQFGTYKIGFYFSYKQVKDHSRVSLGTVMSAFSNPARSNAVFFYKGYKFYYIGEFIDSMFERTGEYIQFRGVKPDKYMVDIDDRGLYWRYIIQNNQLKNISYKNCDDWWHDDRYIGVH